MDDLRAGATSAPDPQVSTLPERRKGAVKCRDSGIPCMMPAVTRLIGGKWKLLILRQLIFGGVRRFGELRREIDGITQTMLTKQLRALEDDGFVTRKVYAEVPPRVEYEATDMAKDLKEFFQAMHKWGARNLQC